jgi:hypothetical protein
MARREHDESTLRQQIENLAREDFEWTQPELQKRRDDLAMARRQGERHAAEQERQTLRAEVGGLHQALDTATAEALRYHADANRTAEQVEELKGSLSWKLTQPLRSVVEWTRRTFRGRS